MRFTMVKFVLLGVLIAGSIAVPLVNSECELCDGTGRLECPACKGSGDALHFFRIECPCRGDPDYDPSGL